MPPVVAAVAAVGSALSAASMAIGGAIGLGTGIAAGVVGGAIVGGALGAATSAIFGGDIEKGALFGAVGGAVAGGFAGAGAVSAAQNAAAGATSGASSAMSGMGSVTTLGALPEQFSLSMAGAAGQGLGSTGYSLGGEGILAAMQPAGAGFGAAGQAAGMIGPAAKTSSDMAAFLSATKEAAASQTKWMMGTEAIKMGASALLEDDEADPYEVQSKLQQQAIDAKKIKLGGVEVPRAQVSFGGATKDGGVASSLLNLRNKGLLGGTASLLGGGSYAKRTT